MARWTNWRKIADRRDWFDDLDLIRKSLLAWES